jgi:dolichyl-phosphate beta-glucosyltransferase
MLQGVQSARGAVILFADADGATKFPDLAKLECRLKDIVKGNTNFENFLCRCLYIKWFRPVMKGSRFKNVLTNFLNTFLVKPVVR